MKLLSLLLALTISTSALADRRHAPFQPHDDKRFDEIEDQLEETSEAASLARKQARFVYDVSVDGGESTGTHALGVTLPAGSVIVKAMLYINTAFADGGTGSLALQCGGTRNILGYADIGEVAMNSLIVGAYEDSQTNAPASAVHIDGDVGDMAVITTAVNSVTSACEVTAVVRGDSGYSDYSAGKLTGIIEYFQFE